jgi:hypothetical protein
VERQARGRAIGQVDQPCPLSDLKVVIRASDDADYRVRDVLKDGEGMLRDPNVLESQGATWAFTYHHLREGGYTLQVELHDDVVVWRTVVEVLVIGESETIQAEFRPRKLSLDRDQSRIAVDGIVRISLFGDGDDPVFTAADPQLVLSIGHERLELFANAHLAQELALDEQHAVTIAKADVADRRVVYGRGRRLGLVEVALRSGENQIGAKAVCVSGPPRFIRCVSDPTTVPAQLPEGADVGWTKARIEAWLACRTFDANAAKADALAWTAGWDLGNPIRACSMHVDGMTSFYSDVGYILAPAEDSPRIRAYNWRDASTPTGLTAQQECDLVWEMKEFLAANFASRGPAIANWQAVLDIEIDEQGNRAADTGITVEFGFWNQPDSIAGVVYSRFRKCLSIALAECSDAARQLAAHEYRRLLTAKLNARIAGRDQAYDVTRDACIDRCVELARLMAKGEHAALDASLKYTEVTIDVVGGDVAGVFYSQADSGRDQNDGAGAIDREGWLARKKEIALQFAGWFNPIVPVFMLTLDGVFQEVYRVQAGQHVEVV